MKRIVLAASVALAGLAPLAPLPLSAQEDPQVGPGSFAGLVKEKAPAVVGIIAERPAPARGPTPQLPPGLRDFFGGPMPGMPGGPEGPGGARPELPERLQRSLGSGFFISADGLVVTNNHVVEGASSVRVALEDGRELDAEILGADPATDIALLQAEGEDLSHLQWGDSDTVEVGDWVVAIGNPFGLGGTVTAGILSARSRDIQAGPYDDFLQTDASINRGNSGGPLFDEGGEVIGVNTAIFSPTGGNVGIGFAVPSTVAQAVVEQLRERGRVVRGYIGVTLQPLDEELAEALGVDAAEGALVASVVPDGPSSEAGIAPGDVIVEVSGEPVEDARALSRAVAAREPGEAVAVTLVRNGERREVEIELAERPQDVASLSPGVPAPGDAPLGVAVAALNPEIRQRIGAPEDLAGLYVDSVTPGSVAAEAGLRPGDVIIAAGGEPVTEVEQLRAAADAAQDADRSLLLRVWREGGYAFLAAPFGQG